MNEEKKDKRGGRREGAGRPKGNNKLYAFRADNDVADFIDAHDNKTEFIRDCILQARQTAADETKIKTLGEVIPANRVKPLSVPFFDVKIVAGFPIPLNNDEMAQDIELLKMLCPNPNSSNLIRVRGNSMIDAGVNDGDILIVDKSNRQPTEKQIAVCELNGEYTVKRVKEIAGKRWLVPANPEYPNIKLNDDDSFSVWGVVTYMISKPKY